MNFATAIAFEPAAIWIGTRKGILVRLAADSAWAMRACGSGAVSALCAASDGASLLAADSTGAVSVLNTCDGSFVKRFSCVGPVVQCRILASHTYVTVDNEGRGFLWSATDDGDIRAMPICQDGRTAARFDRFGGTEQQLTLLTAIDWMIWDRASNSVVADHHPIDGMRLAYIDGLVGLSAGGAHYFMHWDDLLVMDSETEKLVCEGSIVHRAWSAALSDNGRRLAVGTRDGELVVIDDAQTRTIELKPTSHAINTVVWQDDGSRIGWIDEQGGFGVVDAKSGRQIIDRAKGVLLLG